jgi:hypothetical protein
VTKVEAATLGRIVVSAVREYVTRQLDGVAREMRSAWITMKDDVATVRERVAVVEVKPLIPGPVGPAGRDGVDGVGFDDLIVEHDGERAFTFKCVRGDVVKALGTFTLPIPIYRKVWIEGRTYEPCDRVTWAGSEWHCETATTTKPGDGSKAWVLSVKHGRDAKDGRDGAVGPPGPRGPGWEETMDERRRR